MTAPITQSTPDVEVTGPTMSSSCDNLLLDLSGSLGNGGRLWSSLAVAIVGADGYVVSNLTEFINGIGVQYISPPIPIPSKLFQQKSGTYAFKFTLCNFFGGCGTASIEVIIVNVVIPSVSLTGPSLRTQPRSQALVLSADAHTTSCADGSVSRLGIEYVWTVWLNGIP